MDLSQKILSDITHHMKYAKFLPDQFRRETFEETVDRNVQMHIKKFPQFEDEIRNAYKFVYDRKVLPSMRSMQFAGRAIEVSPSRIYNCCFVPIDNVLCFSEVMFLLLGGTGVGIGVQQHQVSNLPEINKPSKTRTRRYLVGDSIEGWADAVKALMKSFYYGGSSIRFDYSDIRPKGARLVTAGGKAPGPQPLKECLMKIEGLLEQKENGDKLSSLEVHDIICIIADAVLAGGIRRSALISLFDADDQEMISCKSGSWWETHPYRGRANNSAVIVRGQVTEEFFMNLWDRIKNSGSGEPGIFLSNDKTMGTNPCKPLNSTILTKDGYITFKQALEKDSLEVLGIDGEWKKATKPFKTGENRIVSRFLLSNGKYLYGTPNHMHLTYDHKKESTWKEMKDINEGDWLSFKATQIHNLDVESEERYNKGLICGWIHGDGWFYKKKNTKNSYTAGMCFGINEFDIIEKFENLVGVKTKDHFQKPDTCKILQTNKKDFIDQLFAEGMTTDKDDISWLYLKDKDFKIGFIKALFTADGSVRKHNHVELYSIRKNVLEVVSNVLEEFGIISSVTLHANPKSYISTDGKMRNNKATYKINVYAGQFEKIGLLSEYKIQKLVERSEEKKIYRHENYVTVKSIEREYSIEDVYDITVDDDSHAFYDTGVVTHNCCEVSLKPFQMCNLVTINASDILDQEDYNNRVRSASFIATLQASYTDFHYLRDIWKRTTEKEALIGVSMTGIASNKIFELNMKEAAEVVKQENERAAKLFGIKNAARATVVKPEGSSSLVLGTSSGIHAWHDKFYIRRIRVGKNEAIYSYLKQNHSELIEDEYFRPHDTAVIGIPQKAPEKSTLRENESSLELLEKIKIVNTNWIKPGHRKGANTNNVSATISVKPDEWDVVGQWMWQNRDSYTGLSVLPFSDHTYVQAPFETCTEEEYNRLFQSLQNVDLSQIFESEDETDLQGELACAGSGCIVV